MPFRPRSKPNCRRYCASANSPAANSALPDNGSYKSYADLGRPYVAWNVFAAPEFSIEPVSYCFAFAGCVGYRGYFSEADAQAESAALRAQGYDAYVGGVPAYSTLGWFDDPVLSTFIHYPEAELARLMFHELAHQLLYVKERHAFQRILCDDGGAGGRGALARAKRKRRRRVPPTSARNA